MRPLSELFGKEREQRQSVKPTLEVWSRGRIPAAASRFLSLARLGSHGIETMDMKTLHEAFLLRGAAAVGRQLRPPQQFSVRNRSRAFIRS